MEAILTEMLLFMQARFKTRKVVEDMGVVSQNTTLSIKDHFGYELRNNGDITAIINGTLLVRPNTAFSNANWEGYTFSDDIQLVFDNSNVYGFNTAGSSKRLEYIIKKLQ